MTTLESAGVAERARRGGVSVTSLGGSVLLLLLFGGVLLWVGPRVSADSASYLECSRNIVADRGYLAGLFDGLDPQRWRALSLWPPGYPLLVARAMKQGISAPAAGLLVAGLSTIVALVMVAGLYRRRFDRQLAGPLLLIFAAMAGLHRFASMCWADGPYLALAVGAFLLITRPPKTEQGVLWCAAASGVLAGFAWCVRNVGLSLIGSIGLFLLLRLLLEKEKRQNLTRLGMWMIGCAIGGGWLALYNISAFGRLSPYSMAPSNLGPVHNILYTSYVILKDFFVLPEVALKRDNMAMAIGAGGMVAAAFLAVVAFRRWSVGVAGRWHEWLASSAKNHGEVMLASIYCLAYTAMIIAARSVYRWGEPISERYMVQVYWAMLFLLGCFVSSKTVRGRWITMLYLLLAMQIAWDVVYVRYFWVQRDQRAEARAVAARLVPMAGDKIILSDAYNILRGYGGLNARAISDDPDDATVYPRNVLIARGRSGNLWGIAIANTRKASEGKYGPLMKELVTNPASLNFAARTGFGDWTVLEWAGSISSAGDTGDGSGGPSTVEER